MNKGHQGKAFVSVVFVPFVPLVVLFIRVSSVFNPWQIDQATFARILYAYTLFLNGFAAAAACAEVGFE